MTLIPVNSLMSILRNHGHMVLPCKTTSRLRVCGYTDPLRGTGPVWETISADRLALEWLDYQETKAPGIRGPHHSDPGNLGPYQE